MIVRKIEYSSEMKPEINPDEIDNLCTAVDNQLRHLYEHGIEDFATAVLSIVCTQVEAVQGVFYLADYEPEPKLTAIGGFGVSVESLSLPEIKHRQGILGELFQEFEQRWIAPLPAGYYLGHSSMAFFQAKSLVIMPLTMNYKLIGAIEILLLQDLHPSYKAFFKRIIDSISILFYSILNNQRIKTLLFESQANAQRLKDKERELEANLAALEHQKTDLLSNEAALRHANQQLVENYQKTEGILQKLHIREAELEQKNQYASQLLAESEAAKNNLMQKEAQLQEQLSQLHDAQKEIIKQKEDLELSVLKANKSQEIARKSLEISQKKMREYNEEITESKAKIHQTAQELIQKDDHIQQLKKDITELATKTAALKRAEVELHSIQKYFQNHTVSFRADAAGSITQINSEFVTFFGIRRQDIVNEHYKNLLQINQETELAIAAQITKGKAWVGMLNTAPESAKSSSALVSIIPVCDERQQLLELIFTIPVSKRPE